MADRYRGVSSSPLAAYFLVEFYLFDFFFSCLFGSSLPYLKLQPHFNRVVPHSTGSRIVSCV